MDEPGGGYLGFVAAQLENAKSWQQAESALFMARAAASAAKRLVVRTRAERARERETPAETRAREGTDAFLRQTLTRIGDARGSNPGPNSAVFASHPLVVAAAARVVGAYAPWLGQAAGRGDPEGVARVRGAHLLAALQAPEAFGHASGAFHALCAQCADAFARRGTVHGLLDAAESALPEAPPAFNNGAATPPARSAAAAWTATMIAPASRRARRAWSPRWRTRARPRLVRNGSPRPSRRAPHATRRAPRPPASSRARSPPSSSSSRVLCVSWSFPSSTRRPQKAVFATQKTSTESSLKNELELEHPALAALGEAWPTLVAFTAEPWRSRARSGGRHVRGVPEGVAVRHEARERTRRRAAGAESRSGTRSPRTTTPRAWTRWRPPRRRAFRTSPTRTRTRTNVCARCFVRRLVRASSRRRRASPRTQSATRRRWRARSSRARTRSPRSRRSCS